MSCNNCCKCFEQADGSIIKRGETDAGWSYTLPDMTIVTTTPADFTSAVEVDCLKFEQAVQPPQHIDILEEVCDDKQTGVLVHVQELADGTKTYTNLATSAEYTMPPAAGCELHTSEDKDYLTKDTEMCDGGVDVIRTIVYVDGDITDVVSTTVTTLDGAAHTLSGDEVGGFCAGQIQYDKEIQCFRDTSSIDNPRVTGYVQFQTNSTTGVTATKWFDDMDVELDKAVFSKVECC